MKNIYPVCHQAGQSFYISTDHTMREHIDFLNEELPLSLYTQQYDRSSGDSVPIHWHEEFQLCWVSSGALDYTVNGHMFRMDGSDLLLINCHQLHAVRLASETAKTLCFNFAPALFHPFLARRLVEPLSRDASFSYQILPLPAHEKVTLERLRSLRDDPLNHLSATAFLTRVMEQTLRSQAGRSGPTESEDLIAMQNALNFIQERFMEPLTLEEICRAAMTGKNRLTALFSRFVGMPPVRYLNDYRLFEARNLVLYTEKPVSQISEETGFQQVSYFVQRFRERYGLSPLQYRKQYRG